MTERQKFSVISGREFFFAQWAVYFRYFCICRYFWHLIRPQFGPDLALRYYFLGGVSPKFSSLWAGALGGLQTAHCWKWNLEGLWHFSPDSLIDWTFSLILLNTQFSFWQFLFAQMVLHFIFFFHFSEMWTGILNATWPICTEPYHRW